MVWSDGGCQSCYLTNGDGHNASIWPGSTMKYRRKTKKIKLSDYNIITPEPCKKKQTKKAIPIS